MGTPPVQRRPSVSKQIRNAHPISVPSPGFLPSVRPTIESPTSVAQLVALPT